ncbi:MAG: histidine triad (HIT) protein [Candidatus Parvarchaeum acidophilus ARMAN-5]|jgi:histidine triad (HIT) family protein|uniref:Histidine triad (HIT) protein n=1 Tax=Candidatus Parvarchaeum acidophilus ARMAN-5 TaxID=662762 RepID=D6GVZ5_PARA5|nr:MAG: histidine triad (HIT) protein [Candidatus Parvarchaeum acidophilus ARMAN-5]EFD92614.1 MAG: histidine triad (HIT) protein [Candidatus Parvarchaeum acidophilus ARMAN-5]
MDEEKCVFCMIINGNIPAKKVYEDQLVLGILDINPASKGHVIMIPKKHYGNIYEVPMNEFLQLCNLTRAIGYAIMLALAPNNVEMLYTKELTKGNITPHALIHLIPRYDDDTVNHVWQPQKLIESDFTAIENAIKDAIEGVKNADAESTTEKPIEKPVNETKKPEAPGKIDEDKPIVNINRKVVVF